MLHHYPDVAEAGPADRPGVVHRLDADTSGVLIFARTLQDLEHLQRQFRERTTGKTYRCVCRGIPNPVTQEVETPIGRHPVHRQKRAVNGSGAKEAFTAFRMLRGLAQGTAAELEVTIRTGRTHQIRVHLDSIGHPVLGDPMYGGRRTTLPPPWPVPPRLLLHAASLRFTHPRTGEAVQVDAPLPKDYLTYCEQLSTP
jgi:23S rRNA pseudouridine1911/1915/1917 synthase